MARDFSLHLDTTKGCVWLSVSPVGWVTWNMTTTLLSLGFTLLLFEGVPYFISRTYFWDLIDEFKVTNLFLPTGVVDEFYKRQLVPTEKHNLDSLKVILAGGSVVKPQIYDFIYKKVKKDVMFCASYGSTELMGSCLILETTLPIHKGESNAVALGDQLEILDEKVDAFPYIRESLCVSHYNKHGDERAVLFLKMADGRTFDNRLVYNIKKAIAEELTSRHVPDIILETKDIPVNMNGKKMEIIVKKIINKMPYNDESVINPESLKNFIHVPELQDFERIFPNVMMLKGS
ncbi:unnamed protein product [Larinioides sclopetarius]|uniref:AMP-dependent synthetase/ligase domain-containing protein n=1 Tax=Larinioides sclopetarius TaxID=280406 RepID=A0AAV2BH18_9ARAC